MAERIRSVVVTIKVDTNKQTYERKLTWGDETCERAAHRQDDRAADGGVMRLREAVRIEIRAAAIAAGMIHTLSHDMTDEELIGWMRRGDGVDRGTYPKSHAWQAGWLAATIYGDVVRTRYYGLLKTASPIAAAVVGRIE